MAYGTSPAMYVGTDASGGYAVDTVLTQVAFMTPQPQSVLRAFLSMRASLGKNIGDTIYRNRWGDISAAGDAVAESATIPVDRSMVLSQASSTVVEFGNSISAHSKLLDLANIDAGNVIVQGLRNDEQSAIDKYLYTNVYGSCMLKYVGTATNGGAFTTNGTATASNTSAFNSYHLRQMVKKLASLNVPRLPGTGRYAAILHLNAADQIYEDGDWQNVQLYKDQFNGITTGYLGTLWGCDLFTETNALTTVATTSGEVFVFGDGFGTEDLVIPAEVRSDYAIGKQMGAATDFGRKVTFAWYEAAAFGVLWNVSASRSHCVHYTSA